MANKEQTYTIKIDAELSSLQKKVAEAKLSLDGFMSSGKAPKGLVSSFEKLEGLLGRISDKSKQAPSKSLFSGVEKDLSNAELLFGEIVRSLDSLKDASKDVKLELFPPESRAQIQAAINGLKEYQKILKDLKEKESEVEAARKVSEKADKAATTAKQAKADIKRKKEKVETKRDSLQGQVTALEADPEKNAVKIAKLKGDIAELDLEIKNLTTDYNTATRTLTEANKAAAEAKTKYEDLSTELDNLETEGLDALSVSAQKAGRKIEEIDGETPRKKMERLNSTMQTFVDDSLAGLPEKAQDAKTAMDGYSESVDDATDKTRQAKQAEEEYQQSLADKKALGDKIKSFLGMAGAAKVLGAAVRNAFQDIKELDKAMSEIAVVTDFSIGDMWEQMPQYTKRANELGLAITEVYEASALFYQQGLDTNEMVALSNETLKMAKIAGLNAADATDRMTAALRGFNMELNETSAQKISDVYSELAAITASDVDEISKAMTKTASIASSAGMEFETTAAFLSQIIETTRESAETAGTAMKTVIARFQELKKSPDEIGEVEGEIVDANAIEGALRSVGVSLRDAGGQFRELDDVFLELSSKWDGLDKNTQRYIATIAAGSRQQSRFIAMMQDYERTQELVTAANNSAGASQRQYEKTLESIETKLARLDNAWTEFSTGLMNSDVVKFAVDFLTSLLNALNKVTQGFDSFTGSFSKISTLVTIFQTAKVVINKLWDNIVADVITSAKRAMDGLNTEVKAGAKKTKAEVEAIASGETTPENKSQNKKLGAYASAKQGIAQIGSANKNFKMANAKGKQIKALDSDIDDKKMSLELLKGQGSAIEEIEEAEAELLSLEKKRGDLIKTQSEYSKKANEQAAQGYKNIANAAQTASQAITLVGVGFGVVGQMFEEAGLTEAGEFFQEFGNILTFVGGVIGALVPIISLLGTTVTVAGEEMTIAGYMAQGAWWPLLLIGLAIAAVVTTIILVADAIKKASPEYKLEKAQEAADKAADAADRATKSYENLVDAFEGLKTGYEALEDLTRGTKEWDEAVKNINNSVLDLIEQYPELAKFVDNEGGVLTIDMDDAGVQQVLKDAEASAVIAKNSSTLANLSVARAEDDLAYKNLDDDAKFDLAGANAAYAAALTGSTVAGAGAGAGIGAGLGAIGTAWGGPLAALGGGVGAIGGAIIGGIGGLIGGFAAADAAKDAALEDTQNTTEALAKAIADGAITDTGTGYKVQSEEKLAKYGIKVEDLSKYYAQVGDSTEALRDFGEQLLQTSAQEEAAFAAVATSAYQLANTLGMTEEEQEQAASIVDDATAKKLYDENMAKLEGIDFTSEEGSDEISDEQRKMRDDAIRAQYGADARIEGNKVTFRDADGKQQTEELTNDEIKAMIANDVTTKQVASAVEIAPATVDHVIKEMGFEQGSAEANAIEKAVVDQEGGDLTAAEAKTLEGMKDEDLKKIYENMSQAQKDVFGTYDDYLKKIKGAGKVASGAFEDAGKNAEEIGLTLSSQGENAAERFANTFGFMTSDMAKGFMSKMEEVYNISGEEGVKQIQDAYNTLLEGKDDKTKKDITARMNAMDWSNAENLLAFELELVEQYGYTREEAQNLTNTMKDAAKATSNLTTTVEIFGDFYHTTEKLNAALKKTTNLQWEYERMLKKGASAIELAANLEEQRQSILEAGNLALTAYQEARDNQSKAYAKGVNLEGVRKDVTQYVHFDPNTGTYDLTELQEQINAGNFGAEGSDERKAVENYISELKEANKLSEDQLEAAKDAYKQLEELNEQAEQGYRDLYDQIGEVITATMQKQIELQQSLLDATKNANSKIVDKLQEQINEDRQIRQNTEAEENIADMYSQMAYLGMDTSGANALSMVDLEEQIAQAEQDYEDSRIDQSIQQLQDANAKAEEQRERQISIAEQQLELYKKSDAYWHDIDTEMSSYLNEYEQYEEAYLRWQDAQEMSETEFNEKYKQMNSDLYNSLIGLANKPTFSAKDTALGRAMVAAGFTEGMSSFAEKDFWNNIENNTALSARYADGTLKPGTQMDDLLTGIENNTGIMALQDYFYQEGYDQANAINTKLTPSLNFSFTEGLGGTTDEEGNIQIGSAGAQKYSRDMSAMETTMQPHWTDYSDNWGTAETKYNTMENIYSHYTEYGISESDWNNPQSSTEWWDDIAGTDAEIELRGDLASGNISSEHLWSNKINAGAGEHGSYETFKQDFKNQAGLILDTIINKQLEDKNYRGYESVSREEDYKNLVSDYNTLFGSGGEEFVGKKAKELMQKQPIVYYSKPQDSDISSMYVGGKSFHIARLIPTSQSSDEPIGTFYMENGKLFYVGEDDEGKKGVYTAGVLDLTSSVKDRVSAVDYIPKNFYGPYKTGGLADFTGPAWLDGTPSKPEYILNAAQTERFFSLVDILEGYDTDKNKKSSSGDNYFDIEINVEKLDNDYDVEQIANKIRRMIYDDATYRNVNAVNHIR